MIAWHVVPRCYSALQGSPSGSAVCSPTVACLVVYAPHSFPLDDVAFSMVDARLRCFSHWPILAPPISPYEVESPRDHLSVEGTRPLAILLAEPPVPHLQSRRSPMTHLSEEVLNLRVVVLQNILGCAAH